jgi:integrase
VRTRRRPAPVDGHRGGDNGRRDGRLGRAGAGNLEPAGGHRPLVRWLLPPAPLAGDDLAANLDRRPEPADRTRAIPLAELERLWRRDTISVRDKALWRFLYETAARASEALSINVEDVDLDNKRVRVRSKGGDTDWLHFQTGSARLLPRLFAGRTRGPLFLADRRPTPARAPATLDRCPETGRARLSYRRAEAVFREASAGGRCTSFGIRRLLIWLSRM